MKTEEPLQLIAGREPDEYASGRIPSSKLIPLGDLLRWLDAKTLVICRTGNHSKAAVGMLWNPV
jgi:rhodanese-related sulfurtransferase